MFKWDRYFNKINPDGSHKCLVYRPISLPICEFDCDELYKYFKYFRKIRPLTNPENDFNLAASKYIEEKVKENV